MKKLGLVLGSSGSRGISYVGFLKALEEHGIKPYCVAGSSMGAVVGACYCNGMTTEQMVNEVNNLKASHLIDVSFAPLRNSAILRSNKLVKKLDEFFKDLTYDDLKIPFCSVAVDLWSGELHVSKGKESLTLGVAASATIPSVFRPIQTEGKLLVDGGVRCRLPIQQAKDMGAEVIVVVDALGETRKTEKDFNIITVMIRSYEIMDGVITKYSNQMQSVDLMIYPELGDMSSYKFKEFDMALDQGYKAGIANVEKIKELIK